MPGREAIVSVYRAEGDEGPEVEVELGGEDFATADMYGPPGEDSPPLPDDEVAAISVDMDGDALATVAYADATPRVAAAGEKRLYSRDSDGSIVASLHLKGDGSVTLEAASGALVEVATDGSIKLSGASVSLQLGEPLGNFLSTLHTGIATWVPVPQDGGAALKGALASWITQVPPGP